MNIFFKTITRFLGKNGLFKCIGVNITPTNLNDGKPYITIAPITSKKVVGRCMIRIPVENIPDLINSLHINTRRPTMNIKALEEVCNILADQNQDDSYDPEIEKAVNEAREVIAELKEENK